MNNSNIPIIGQKNTREIGLITLPQPDGSFVQVQGAAVVAIAPEVVAAIASGILAALNSQGFRLSQDIPSAPKEHPLDQLLTDEERAKHGLSSRA